MFDRDSWITPVRAVFREDKLPVGQEDQQLLASLPMQHVQHHYYAASEQKIEASLSMCSESGSFLLYAQQLAG